MTCRKRTIGIKRALKILMLFMLIGIMGCGQRKVNVARDEKEFISNDGASTDIDIAIEPKEVFKANGWGLVYSEGAQPVGNASSEDLAWYSSYYIGSADEKNIYLTFDCGYENGNTELILKALKKHNAKGTFFMTGEFLEKAPKLVSRILEQGHETGNHTWNHPDMSAFTDKKDFQKELKDVENLFYKITGSKVGPYYRPPEGKCNEENLRWAKEMGYHTIFWSLAYVDWKQDNQPDPEESIELLSDRVSPGAIVLLHNTSQTNGIIIDELLTRWEEMGYNFRPLSDLCSISQ